MWAHLFTLQALAKELNDFLLGSTVYEIFTQHKNELIATTSSPSGIEQSIVISVDPKLNYIFACDRVPRARKNSVDIFREAFGSRITDIYVHRQERIVVFHLDNNFSMHVQLFGTAESNVFLVNNQGVIRKAFKRNKRFEGKPLERAAEKIRDNIVHNPELFTARLREHDAITIFAGLKSMIPFLGSANAREILHRASIEENSSLQQLTIDDLERIYVQVQELLKETHYPKPTIYFRNNEPRVFSVVPLRHLSGARAESYASVNEAIRATVFRSLRSHVVEGRKNELIKKLKSEHNRTQRSLAAVQEEGAHADRAEQYERIGNIIIANLLHLTKGTRVVDLENIFSEKREQIHITLDPKLTPAQNAEQYFVKAKKARTAREEAKQRTKELREKISLIDKLLLHLDQCQTKEQVEEFVAEHKALLQQWKISASKDPSEQVPFRMLTVTGSLEVWVGKSSENNDLLTMKYAKPNDLWFHVRGASGSHVVLKIGGGKTQPPKEAILQAASIAAYYSKMRNASMVPVAYCERKYVRKPKGAKPGTVVLEREKVIFIEPGLP